MKTSLLRGPAVAAMLSAVVTLSACGAGSTTAASSATASSTAAKADPALASLVPQQFRSSGVIPGGASFDTNPMNYYDAGNKPAGVLIDLLDAAAAKLGVKISWTKVPYAGLIPALQAERVDIAGSQISKTPANSGVVNLLAFYKASSSVVVPKGKTYNTQLDVCGLRFGITTGSTINKDIADGVNSACTSAGKPGLQLQYYDSFGSGEAAVRSGRVDAFLNSTPQILLAAKQDPSISAALVGQLATRVTGIALPLAQTQLTNAFAKSLQAMIDDGSYTKILQKWDLATMAVDKVELNGDIK